MGFIDQLMARMERIYSLCGDQWFSRTDHGRNSEEHPIRVMFREVDSLLRSGPLPRDLMAYPSIGKVMDLGTSLSWTMPIPGFDDQLKQRLLNASDYEAALYELRVARRHAQARQDVRLLEKPGQTETGADVQIFSGSQQIRVEAKRKDNIEVSYASNLSFQPVLAELTKEALDEFPIGVDVTVAIMNDPSEASYREAARVASAAVAAGERGSRYIAKPGFWLIIDDREPIKGARTLPELEASIWPRPGKFKPIAGPPGTPPTWEGSTFGLFAISGQNVDSVLDSIGRASGQIGKGSKGIVYIHVEHGGLNIEAELQHLILVGCAVERRVWGGGQNSRIKALVMTGGPYTQRFNKDGYIYHGTFFRFATFFRGGDSPEQGDDVTALLERVLNAAN